MITGSLAERRLARRVATAAGIGPEGNLAGLFDVAGLAGTVAAPPGGAVLRMPGRVAGTPSARFDVCLPRSRVPALP